jgi:hypothetical protein
MHMPSAAWIRGALVVILYCLVFLKTVKSGFRPGPKDSKKMADRIIRAGGGMFLLLCLLLAVYILKRYQR